VRNSCEAGNANQRRDGSRGRVYWTWRMATVVYQSMIRILCRGATRQSRIRHAIGASELGKLANPCVYSYVWAMGKERCWSL
jgi:hypothetical protein